MLSLLALSGSRRAKWAVFAFWFAVFFGLNAANIFDKFADAEQNRSVDYLPQNAESVEVLEKVEDFPSGERFAAVVVYRRDGGLTPADRTLIAKDRAALASARFRAPAGEPTQPTVSPDRTTALVAVPLKTTGEAEILGDDVDKVREVAEGAPPGSRATRSTSSSRSTARCSWARPRWSSSS